MVLIEKQASAADGDHAGVADLGEDQGRPPLVSAMLRRNRLTVSSSVRRGGLLVERELGLAVDDSVFAAHDGEERRLVASTRLGPVRERRRMVAEADQPRLGELIAGAWSSDCTTASRSNIEPSTRIIRASAVMRPP